VWIRNPCISLISSFSACKRQNKFIMDMKETKYFFVSFSKMVRKFNPSLNVDPMNV
jgi:hypothetical protein